MFKLKILNLKLNCLKNQKSKKKLEKLRQNPTRLLVTFKCITITNFWPSLATLSRKTIISLHQHEKL